MSKIDFIQTPDAPAAIGPYAQGVIAGGLIFTSGQIPLTTDGKIVSDDVREQTAQVFANLKAVLESAGSSLAKVVKATVFLVDMSDFPVVNEVYVNAFADHRPARSTVQVARLPRDAKVEIEVTALV